MNDMIYVMKSARLATGMAAGAALLLCAAAASAQAQPVPQAAIIARCTVDQFSVGTDAENGAFNGLSHGGTLLVLRNISATPCAIEPFARVALLDNDRASLGVTTDNTPGFPHPTSGPLPMGHGPYVAPITIAAGAEATAVLRWSGGAVYPDSACVNAGWLAVTVADGTQRTPLHARICGLDAAHIVVHASRLALDPVMPV